MASAVEGIGIGNQRRLVSLGRKWLLSRDARWFLV